MILVTGGAGFIGSNFIYSWLQNNEKKIINIDKLTYASNLDNLESLKNHDRYQFIEGDIGDKEKVLEILKKFKVEGVINFAAESHVDRSINSPAVFFKSNVIGTLGLLEAVREYITNFTESKKKKFVFLHVSTDEVYGSLSPTDKAFTENSRYKPNSPYSASKASTDHLVRSWNATFDIPTIITNCSNNYGPYQNPEKLIPLIIQKILNEEKIPIYGNGSNIRDWLYVKDHCSAIEMLFKSRFVGETFNIGGNSEKTNLEIVNIICEKLDILIPRNNNISFKNLISFVPDRMGHDFRYAVDITKLKSKLNWTPSVSFEEGLEITIDWYLNNIDWLTKAKKNL